MTLDEALEIKDPILRNEAITDLIREHDWDPFAEDMLEEGGWYDIAIVDDVNLLDDTPTILRYRVTVTFEESVTTGCKDMNGVRERTAYLKYVINKISREYKIETIEFDGDEIDDYDFYPDDYN
jgi:hypothetical protein